MRAAILTLALATLISFSSSQADDDAFSYSRGPVPSVFHPGTRYPERNETEECRPIRLRIVRNSRLYRTRLVTNVNPDIIFRSPDARVMTARIQARLNALAAAYRRQYHARITVLRSWSDYSANDGIGDPHSLHYEGERCRLIRAQLIINLVSVVSSFKALGLQFASLL